MRPLEPGQYFRNTDSQGCSQRIKKSRRQDLPDLKAALLRESNSRQPRQRLLRRLSMRIEYLAGLNGGKS